MTWTDRVNKGDWPGFWDNDSRGLQTKMLTTTNPETEQRFLNMLIDFLKINICTSFAEFLLAGGSKQTFLEKMKPNGLIEYENVSLYQN